MMQSICLPLLGLSRQLSDARVVAVANWPSGAIRPKLADFGSYHWHRQHGDSRAGIRGGAQLPPMTKAQAKAILAKTAKAASRGEFELFKTTSVFDGTARNPKWLGEEPQRVQQVMPA